MIRPSNIVFSSLAVVGLIAASCLSIGGLKAMNEARVLGSDERKELWKQVERDLKQGLPESAIKKLKSIYASASEEKAYPEATTALCRQFWTEGQKNQPTYPHVIKRMQAAIPDAPEPMQPIMKAVLAKWFYAYYIQNRWRFQQRTQTQAGPSDDFETWDLRRLLREIDKHYTDALASADNLKKIPISDMDPLVSKGTVDDSHRPTLYDFIAFEALDFYSLDEQFIRQQGAFEIGADSPIFAASDSFFEWDPATEDEDSYLLKAVRIYQDLLRFHQTDDNRTAWLDADLGRLMFGRMVANGDEAKVRYRAALQRFADDHVAHPLSSIALAQLAQSLRADEENIQALEIATQGKARFPKSVGARRCHNVILEIEAKSSQVTTERIWSNIQPTIDVQYRNIEKAWFRLIEFDFENWEKWNGIHGKEFDALLRKAPVAQWSVDLPKTADYKQRTESVPVNVDVKSGCYLVVSSHNANFTKNKNAISVAEVWISQLSVIMKHKSGTGGIEGWVVDADSGEPVGGVSIQKTSWKYDGRKRRETNLTSTSTDKSGRFHVPSIGNHVSTWLFTHDDQKFGLVDRLSANSYRAPKQKQNTVFFTDRAIYRPGQSVQFKGVCVRSDRQNNDYKTIPGRNVTVALYDANNQEVERRKLRTNEFGSFSGSFTAPRDRTTGVMRLQCNGINGRTSFRVEEYKRPKFLVEIDKPTEAFRLGQKVKIKGNATAYTGAPIDSSKVTWRVERNVRYPAWYMMRYWYMPFSNNSQEIANGQSETNTDGVFEIEFDARPDASVDRESDPVFNFTIYADVTDSAGETRSASQTTSVGYRSLEAELSSKDWQTVGQPVEMTLKVTTLDGEAQRSTGKLSVYKLTPPKEIQRGTLLARHSWSPRSVHQSLDLSKINAWPTGESVHEKELSTDDSGETKTEFTLGVGAYKAVFEATDSAGQKVLAEQPIMVIDPGSEKFSVKVPSYFQVESDSVEPGEEFVAVWGTGYMTGRALIELEHRGKVFKSYWTDRNETQQTIRLPIKEKHRGGVQLRVTYVRDNRIYSENHAVNVPWSNKELTIKWEHFVSKLQPGGRETWTAVVTGPNAEKTVAEMVAGMYDASLDAFVNHPWQNSFNNFFYRNYSSARMRFYNQVQSFMGLYSDFGTRHRDGSVTYRHFSHLIGINTGYHFGGRGGVALLGVANGRGVGTAEMGDGEWWFDGAVRGGESTERDAAQGLSQGREPTPEVDLSQVSPRKNLQETAFFYPHLKVDGDGSVRIEFEIPEALTKWKFMGFAHDNELKASLLTDEMTTSKDLMVQPNPPRFLREGDLLEFSVKVTNQSDADQTGSVRLTFADARTAESVDAAFANEQLDQDFEVPANQSKSLFWKIKVPDFVGALTYKAVGGTEKLSDGEEGFLPVLSKRILVTESLPLPIRGNQNRHFDFERLKLADQNNTLQSQTLTVQMTSNPAWYAVMSLPYLMEYPHECSEQVFNRLYANALGQHIVSSDPKIERVFEQWRNTDALDSPLEKNEDLRNVLIAESPWLRAGKKESQARRDVGILFDKNRLTNQQQRSLQKLAEMQLGDGAWPWFPGGRANDYITLYVTTGFGRLRHLGVGINMASAVRAVDRLDWFIDQKYQGIKRHGNLDKNNLSQTVCLYLYGRSFYLKDRPINDKYRESFDYFVGQAKKHWASLKNRQSQGHIAIGLKRIGDGATPAAIMESLTERSLTEDELGMFWREGEQSWWWYRAPIETQALMIEAYDEVAGDKDRVEELKIWLLKQKQTQNWKTTKATADACYGLLLRGTNNLASDALVSVKLGGTEIKPEAVEAGTGFYEQKFVRGEIKSEMGQIDVAKSDEGIAWGSVHWQYLEDVGKIKPYEGTPLTLKKSLFIKKNTKQGPVLEAVDGPVAVGDELVMRVEVRVDQAMEYVHLKDYRGSGTEPVNVLSRYKFQDGLAYYESTKDTASHFFIDYLPRGTYVFEYSVRVQHRGVYETGIAELQCMYAPEFNSHSGSVEITVE